MLNCGATVELGAHLSLREDMKCIVLDSHKPIHIGNIQSGEQVVVVNDGTVDESEIPSDLSEESSEESEESEESEMDEETRNRKREIKLSREARRQRNDKKRRLLANYNEFNYYSRPTSIQVSM